MKKEPTNSSEEHNPWNEMINMIIESGMEGVPKAVEILVNEAMKIERDQALGARSYQRSENRLGYANGYKDKVDLPLSIW